MKLNNHQDTKTTAISSGLSPDAPIVANAKGGKQSQVSYGFHLMDARAMFRLAEVLQYGATRYERDNWRKIDAEDHLNHLLGHAFAWLAGDTQDDHPGHLLTRAMMFVAVLLEEEAKHEQAAAN